MGGSYRGKRLFAGRLYAGRLFGPVAPADIGMELRGPDPRQRAEFDDEEMFTLAVAIIMSGALQ